MCWLLSLYSIYISYMYYAAILLLFAHTTAGRILLCGQSNVYLYPQDITFYYNTINKKCNVQVLVADLQIETKRMMMVPLSIMRLIMVGPSLFVYLVDFEGMSTSYVHMGFCEQNVMHA